MSRGMMDRGRPIVVWLTVTVAALLAGRTVPGSWRAAGAAAPADQTVADALVAGCATLLAVALGWLWLVTSATAAQVLAGAAPSGDGTTRRLVLLACGVAVVAGTAVPAHADGGGDAGRAVEQLVGLSLPDRAVAPSAPSAEPRTRPVAATRTGSGHGERYVVRPGDSLWSIAQAHPARGDDVERRWRAIWAANRDVVGADPDLIHPGQALRLPATDPRTHTDEDGAR
ncbi:LysM peptidoglycan-binding domain-containing protein [Nocardioides eburneiflavus]|nr:LysM peptidoglycan-binding domain-containing protein [Nocardioides eburneiflavus]